MPDTAAAEPRADCRLGEKSLEQQLILDYYELMDPHTISRRFRAGRSALLLCAVLALVLAIDDRSAHSSLVERTAHGTAPITNGNISAARAGALSDAQQKAVLAALTDQVSVDTLSSYFVTLHNLFIKRPEVYVQRFKILRENSLLNSYTISIKAIVDEELLRRDLESIGVHGPVQERLQMLLMVAETVYPDKRYSYWWAPDPAGRTMPFDVSSRLAVFFRERGIDIVSHSEIPPELLKPEAGQVLPAREAILKAARQAGASIVLLGRVRLKPIDAPQRSSFAQVQCDISVEVLSVRTREPVLHTATHSLGVHIDREAAAQDAITKACAHIVEQILDRVFLKIRTTHAFTLRCTFAGVIQESTVNDFFAALRATLPDIEHLDVRSTGQKRIHIADILSSIDSAALVQKALKADPGGFQIALDIVEDNAINITITPPRPDRR